MCTYDPPNANADSLVYEWLDKKLDSLPPSKDRPLDPEGTPGRSERDPKDLPKGTPDGSGGM